MILPPKMPAFYIIIARKIFFPFFWFAMIVHTLAAILGFMTPSEFSH